MSYGKPDVYHQPEHFGLEIVDSVEWSDGFYQFDTTVVWRDPETGEFFYADDSGCSCPSPFEDFTTRKHLTPVTAQEFAREMATRVNARAKYLEEHKSWTEDVKLLERVKGDVGELVMKMRAFLPPVQPSKEI